MADVPHFLTIRDQDPSTLDRLVAEPESGLPGAPLAGRGVALVFEKPSLRTRHSSEIAVVQLGGHPVYTRGEEVGFDTRESVEDATRILAGYHALIAARVHDHETLRRMAAVSAVPVVNLLSDLDHPLQAVADAITMTRRFGSMRGLRVAWVGDFNNVARSLTEIVVMLGGTMAISCPGGYGPANSDLSGLGEGSVLVASGPEEAVAGAHAVHTDTWISMGQENESERRRAVFASHRVTSGLMSLARHDAVFMHCMPAHRGEEVDADVIDGTASLVIAQGHARLDAARAVFRHLANGARR